MFETVLFPIDQNREAFETASKAIELAKNHQSHIILLSIVSWLFTTVLEMDEVIQQHTIRIENLLDSEKYLKYELKELDKTVTNIRIQVGKVTAH